IFGECAAREPRRRFLLLLHQVARRRRPDRRARRLHECELGRQAGLRGAAAADQLSNIERLRAAERVAMSGTGRRLRVNPLIAGFVAGVLIAVIVGVMATINLQYGAPWASTHTLTAQVSDADSMSVG